MIQAILIDKQKNDLQKLKEKIIQFCPQVFVKGTSGCIEYARKMIQDERPDLVIFDINLPEENIRNSFELLPPFDFESLVVIDNLVCAEEAIKYNISGYIEKPIRKCDLIIAIDNVSKRIQLKKENKKNQQLLQKILSQLSGNDLIGVPTLEGFDFYPVAEIIRCEGMQRCTRIVTKSKTNIISSYNLGEFKKLLEPYGFFSPHKSHLINLGYVKKYKREGTVTLVDNASIPVSRTKKTAFLDCMTHL